MKKDLQEQIFCLLGKHFSYADEVVASFAVAASVRFGVPETEIIDEVGEITSERNSRLFDLVVSSEKCLFSTGDIGLFKLNGYAQRQELCHLDRQNLRKFVERNLNPEMKRYLSVWLKEVEHKGLVAPSPSLAEAERRMIAYLGNRPYEEGSEKVSGIANATLRVMLQEWLLYPELIADADGVGDIVCSLELSNCDF